MNVAKLNVDEIYIFLQALSKYNLVKCSGKFFNAVQNLIGSREIVAAGEFARDHNAPDSGAHGGGKTARRIFNDQALLRRKTAQLNRLEVRFGMRLGMHDNLSWSEQIESKAGVPTACE